MTKLAPVIESFFTGYLMTQRQASRHTIASYRDAFKQLLGYARQHTGKLPAQLDLADVDARLIGAFLTVSYPLLKRFFPMPQLYLGISFGGWSVPMAFAAQTGELPRVAWVLYIAAVIWTAMYDTLYAMVDREDDLKIGVKSSAVLFADMDRLLIGVMQAMTLGALYLVGRTTDAPTGGASPPPACCSCGSSGSSASASPRRVSARF